MAYMKEIPPKTSCPRFILQDNSNQFKNEEVMSVFNSLGIKHIYSNPYYPKGNSRIENVHNFLAKFTYGSQLEWDDVLPLATYCYNIVPSMDDLESPLYLVYGRDPLEGRLSNLKKYCTYLGDKTQGNSSAGAEEAACQIVHGEQGYQTHKQQEGN